MTKSGRDSKSSIRQQTSLLFPIGMWGGLLVTGGLLIFVATSATSLLSGNLKNSNNQLASLSHWSGMAVIVGLVLLFVDVRLFATRRRLDYKLLESPTSSERVSVALTAFNDQQSIGDSVLDFLEQPEVARVLVIDNNSTDQTEQKALEAGAIVIKEQQQGYGHCVYRGLIECSRFEDTELVVICEGDGTFRASDLRKLLAYIPHADIVNGTRIVEQLRSYETQLTRMMFWGNFGGGKLLELKHLGRGTITDLGTTYKICRTSWLRKHLATLDPSINLEFNAHFLDQVLRYGGKLVEAPITFYPRVGFSKGGNVSNWRAVKVGVRMFIGIVFSWRFVSRGDS